MPSPSLSRSGFVSAVFTAGILVAFGPGSATSAAAQQVGRIPVEAVIPFAPTEARALGRGHLVYEIHLTNFGRDTLLLTAVAAFDAASGASGAPLDVAAGAAIPALFVGPPVPRTPAALAIPPGRRAVLLRWLSLAPGASAPEHLEHRLIFGQRDTLRLAAESVDRGGGPMVEAAVGGRRWVAVRAPSNGSGHRTSIVPLHGSTTISQRFAVDWVRLGEDGRFFAGDPSELRSWFGYGSPVRAASAGVVVAVSDGMPDRPPLVAPTGEPVEAVVAPGNRVTIRLDDGSHAMYAHLQAGSLRVAAGDVVAAGDILGLIGNSGNSLAPHLHFDISDSAAPLEGEGLPFRLRAFRLVGRLDDLNGALRGDPWLADPARPARDVVGEIPLENMVLEIAD